MDIQYKIASETRYKNSKMPDFILILDLHFLCLTVERSSLLRKSKRVFLKLLFQKHSMSLLYAQSSFVFTLRMKFPL